MDLLSDILRTLRLRGTVYFRADFRAPWGMEVGGNAVASFHLVERGSCWLRTKTEDSPLELVAGDVVLFPRGAAHDLLCEPTAATLPAPALIPELLTYPLKLASFLGLRCRRCGPKTVRFFPCANA